MLGVVFTIAFLAYRDCSAAAGYFGCAYPLAGMFVLALVVFCYSLLLRSRFRISVTVIGIASIRSAGCRVPRRHRRPCSWSLREPNALAALGRPTCPRAARRKLCAAKGCRPSMSNR